MEILGQQVVTVNGACRAWRLGILGRHSPHTPFIGTLVPRVSDAADDVIDFLAIEPLMQVPGVRQESFDGPIGTGPTTRPKNLSAKATK